MLYVVTYNIFYLRLYKFIKKNYIKIMSVIDNSTLRKKVYDNISNRILEAQLLPGERMNLRNLSAELGVSISPIRDALWKLESEGSIVIEANKKIYISELKITEVDEIFSIRLLLESKIIKEAYENRSPKTIEIAKKRLDLMIENSNNPKEYLIANSKFHFYLYSLSNSPLSLHFIKELWGKIAPYYSLHITTNYDCQTDLSHHKAILKAFTENDKKLLVKALHEDILGSKKFIRDLLK